MLNELNMNQTLKLTLLHRNSNLPQIKPESESTYPNIHKHIHSLKHLGLNRLIRSSD